MITLTPAAAEQVRQSAKEGRMEGMPLRLAVSRQADNSLQYAMGFDDVGTKEEDHTMTTEGIEVVVAPASLEMLDNTVVDYVELEPGDFQFIFMNPNDPDYKPPEDNASAPPSPNQT